MPTFNISNKYGSLPITNATITSAGIVQLASTLVSNDSVKAITPSVLFNNGVSFLSGQMNAALSAGYGTGASGYVLPYATTSVAGGVVLASTLTVGNTSAVVTPSLFINSGANVLSASMNSAISGTPYNASVVYTDGRISSLSSTVSANYGVSSTSGSMNQAISATPYNASVTYTNSQINGLSATYAVPATSAAMNAALSANYGASNGGMVWSTISSNTLATNNHGYSVNLAGGSITLSAPTSPTDGYQFGFRALTNGTNNTLTIYRNGANIEGSANDMVFDVADSGGTYVYNTAQGWCLTTDIGKTNSGLSGGGGGGTSGSVVGYKTLYIPVTDMYPRSNNGCSIGSYESTSAKIHLETLDFDPVLTQYAQFNKVMPEDWDLSTIKTKFNYFTDSLTGNIAWNIQARAVTSNEAIDTTFGTAVSALGSVTSGLVSYQSSATPAITVGNNPILGDMVQFQVYRDKSNASDTLSGNARLVGVWIQYYGSLTPAAW